MIEAERRYPFALERDVSGPLPSEPVLSREQVRRIDQLAVERYGIPGLVLMENAGRGAAEIVDGLYGPQGRASIICGTGNNGGDGCVIARHLYNRGWTVEVHVVGPESRMTHDTRANWNIIRAMGLPAFPDDELSSAGARLHGAGATVVIVDALLGTGFTGLLRSPLVEWIDMLNAASKRAMIAIDVPSGLDADTGNASNTAIRADVTVTFVARKCGFERAEAAAYLGRVEVVDIGAPRELIALVSRGDG